MDENELNLLEKRAKDALSGYGSDVNITCYVYGKDVLRLVQSVRKLKQELEEIVGDV